MSDTDKDRVDDVAEDEAGQETAKKPRLATKRLIVYGGVLLLVLGGGGGAAYYLGLMQPSGREDSEPAVVQIKPAVFYDLPDITVNLASVDQRSQYLRMKVALQVPDRDTVSAIVPLMPRVLDAFQVYLRELRMTDLEGFAGIYRLKEELRRRVNLAVQPARIDDILFKELLIQ